MKRSYIYLFVFISCIIINILCAVFYFKQNFIIAIICTCFMPLFVYNSSIENYLKRYSINIKDYYKAIKSHKVTKITNMEYCCKNCGLKMFKCYTGYTSVYTYDIFDSRPITTTCEEQQCKDILL